MPRLVDALCRCLMDMSAMITWTDAPSVEDGCSCRGDLTHLGEMTD